MNIAAMNVRLTIQKNEVIKDKYGNHTNTWTDFYTCWATPVQSGGSEKQEAGTINSTDAIDFTVRYAKCLDRTRLHKDPDPAGRQYLQRHRH
jgi:SPP1 family predicted phage head-tail adaptor